MSENIKELTISDFTEDVLESGVPVLVDFWASWCGPCRMLAPVMEEVSLEAGENAAVFKVNVDEQGELATAYGVRSIPTVIRFESGEETGRLVGLQSKDAIMEFLKI